MSDSINPNLKRGWQKRPLPKAKELAQKVLEGDRLALSQSITLLESLNEANAEIGYEVLDLVSDKRKKSFRIGITGTPGVGKSTFLDQIGMLIIDQLKQKVAVLTIDPSSKLSKGSILGDKTRMESLSQNENAFIRPSPNNNEPGGVGSKTFESILLCEAAGFDWVFVETVGVGQSETDVFNMTDFFLMLTLPNAGDELQGIKRGIMELVHGIVINKVDSNDAEILKKAEIAKNQIESALDLLAPITQNWKTPVQLVSSLEGKGIVEIVNTIQQFYTVHHQQIESNQIHQLKAWMENHAQRIVLRKFYNDQNLSTQFTSLLEKVNNDHIPIAELRNLFLK